MHLVFNWQLSQKVEEGMGDKHAYGMLLRKRAEELVELMEKTKAELASSHENINGDIYIGCGETFRC